MTEHEIIKALDEIGKASGGGIPAIMTINDTGGPPQVSVFWKWPTGGSTTAGGASISEAIAKARHLIAHPPEFVC